MRKTLLLATLGALLAHNTAASAACTRADLGGTWQVYLNNANFDSNTYYEMIRCTFTIPSTGSATTTNSVCYGINSTSAPTAVVLLPTVASSSWGISTACHVVGQVAIHYKSYTPSIDTRVVEAWLSPDKGTMLGMISSTLHGQGSFNAVKQ
jgi:hypothetical protein